MTTEIINIIERETVEVSIAAPEVVEVEAGAQGPPGPQGITVTSIQLEAGEDLTVGTPVYVAAHKLYAADNQTNYKSIGVASVDCPATLLATVETSGMVDMSGLVSGESYYLGDGVLTLIAPDSGYLVRMGKALSDTLFLVSIESTIFL